MHTHCCVTNFHKLTIATHSTYSLSHSLCGSGVQAWISWVLCFRNTHMVCGPGLQSPLETCLGKDPPPSSWDVGRTHFLVPCMVQSRKQHPFTFAVFCGLKQGAALVGQRLRFQAASALVPCLIPGQGTSSHTPRLQSSHAAAERTLVPQRGARRSQINQAVLEEASPSAANAQEEGIVQAPARARMHGSWGQLRICHHRQ